MAAHGLAKYAQCVDDFVTWMEETPPIISSEISSDVNQLLQAALVEWNGFFKLKKKKFWIFHNFHIIILFVYLFDFLNQIDLKPQKLYVNGEPHYGDSTLRWKSLN